MNARQLGLSLLLLIVAVGSVHALWFHRDQRSAFWDQERYTLMALDALEVYEGKAPARQLLHLHPSHPPGHALLAGAWAGVFGRSYRSLRLFNLLLVSLGLLAVALFANALAGARAALLAAAFWGLSPFAFDFAHVFYTEHLLVPLVLAVVWSLQRSEGLTRRAPLILAGLLSGFALLVRWSFPLYVLVPSVVALAKGKKPLGALIVAALALVVAAPWYAIHLDDIRAFMATGVSSGDGALNAVSGLRGKVFYGLALAKRILGVPLCGAFLVSATWILFRRRRLAVPLVLTPLITLVAFSFLMTKGERHVLATIPFCCVAVAVAVDALRPRARLIVSLLLLLHVGAASGWLAFGPAGRTPQLRVGPIELPLLADRAENAPGPADRRSWPAARIEAACEGSTLLLFNGLSFGKANFVVAALERSADPRRIELIANHYGAEQLDDPRLPDPFAQVVAARSLVVKTGERWVRYKSGLPIHLFGTQLAEELLLPSSPLRAAFEVKLRTELPDGSTALVLERRLEVEIADAVARFALENHPSHEASWRQLVGARPEEAQRPQELARLGIWTKAIAAAESARIAGRLDDDAIRAAVRSAPLREFPWRRFAGDASSDLRAAMRELLDELERSRVRSNPAQACLALAELYAKGREGWPLKTPLPAGVELWLGRAYAADRKARTRVEEQAVQLLGEERAKALIARWKVAAQEPSGQ